ncbi:MAG: tetratricopeptide repeat protein [Verrucomicrobia bacterium]|nr:tetratricopeptide repeat protein [Verrucomicrobiota bacterium]
MTAPVLSPCFSIPRQLLRVGFAGFCLLGLVLAGRAETARPPDAGDAPVALRAALGWQDAPGENYRPYETGSVFAVKTDPSKWPAALALAEEWAASAPEFARDPVDNLFRRFTLIEALVLNADNQEARARLKKERASLAEQARGLRDAKPPRMQDWRARQLADAIGEVNKGLGDWLADTPAERLDIFRDELASLQPRDRKKLAAAYGGEENLDRLIKDAREYYRLTAELDAIRRDDGLKDEAKKQAVGKAMAAMGFFEGYHYDDKDLGRLMHDQDLAGELRGESNQSEWQTLNVPELVEWTDAAGAEALLREAYALPAHVQFSDAPRTRELAKTLILAGKITPKIVPWALVEWPDDRAGPAEAKSLAALYDGLHAQFAALDLTKPATDWRTQSGLARLASALAGVGRTDEALVLLKAAGKSDPSFPYHGWVDRRFAGAVWDFLVKAQGADVKTEAWSMLSSLASQAGRGKELVDWASAQEAAAPAGSPLARTWKLRHGWALVASDDPEAALAILMPIFDKIPTDADKDFAKEWGESAERLLKLAVALEKADLAQKLRADLLTGFKDPHGLPWDSEALFTEFAHQEIGASHAATVEQLLRARLAAKPDETAAGSDRGRNFPANSYSTWLADVLAREGKHEEALKWLAESPYWENHDLAQMLNQGSGGWRPLALITAESLHATGHDDQAVAILEAYLPDHAADDQAEALYTSILGVKALPLLEKLRAMDHYEERPLIWTAVVLLAAGRADEAETAVKRAIAIDPSDGGTPHGDRMRAYAVAREIALKKGDAKQADFFAGVVGAIRMAEGADDLVEAGLISRAITQYERSLRLFEDAYCIQSRLAIRLAGENRMDEAVEHYKRAYELMPDSFGRVESHCFGCEKAFAGEQPQAIAERVFTALIAKPPVKPQAFYLMGYLRMEQERWDDAAGYFTQAVAADPEYLNAWDKLGDVLKHTARPREELDRVAFQLFALDPYQRHGSSQLSGVRDLPALWKRVAAVDRASTQTPEKLYPLGDRSDARGARRSSYHPAQTDYSPAGVLANHDLMRAVVQTLDNLYDAKQNTE